jgi:hypothetical protein
MGCYRFSQGDAVTPTAYYDSLMMLKLALLEARSHAEKVLAFDTLNASEAGFLWNNLTGMQYVIRQEAERVKATSVLEEDYE